MRLLWTTLLLALQCFALQNIPSQLLNLYHLGHYNQACDLGVKNLPAIESNEGHLSLYAFACLQADQLDRLGFPISQLTLTSEARANASYFSMLIIQKKLLIQSIHDQTSLSSLSFPTSSHLLSKVFKLYTQSPQANKTIKAYTNPNDKRTTYKLYAALFNGKKTIAIDEYYDKILIMHHVY